MAENPFFNRVDERDGSVIMDISDTTATANDVLAGKKFYSASGAPSTGTLVPGTITEVRANGTSVATSGIADIPAASTSGYGVTKLNNTTSSTSTSEAATAAVVKQLNDKVGNVAGASLQSQIDAINSNFAPQVIPFSISNSNITRAERMTVKKYGKLCIIDLTFTVGTAITGFTEELFSGLPKNGLGTETRFRVPHASTAGVTPLVLAINNDGKIVNQWSAGGIGTGVWSCQAVYITGD